MTWNSRIVRVNPSRPVLAYLHNLLFLIGREQVGHLARVEERVDILEERLLLDLRVGQEEHGWLAKATGGPQRGFDVVTPLLTAWNFQQSELYHNVVVRVKKTHKTCYSTPASQEEVMQGWLK